MTDGGLAIRAPEYSPNDEAIAVRVRGADPGERVEFEATLVDDDGVTWRSRATFTADDDGTIDLTERAPDAGDWAGVAPMGWLWSMTADADVMGATLTDPETTVDLRASTADDETERTVTRVVYDADIRRREVDSDDVVGALYLPVGEGPHPGVVTLHGSAGKRSERSAKQLATRGFATLSVAYFGEADPIPDDHRRIPLSYFDAAVDWLRDLPGVAADRVGLFGVSRGAELALLLGARRDWVGAVVSFAGSGLAWDTPSGEPAWVDAEERVPHLSGTPTPGATVEAGLDDEQVEEAAIAVEETDGPVLLVSGGDDGVWQSRELSDIAAERLERADFEYDFEHRTYDDVGHLVGIPYVPLAEFDQGGGTARATARAGADVWPVALDYLRAAGN